MAQDNMKLEVVKVKERKMGLNMADIKHIDYVRGLAWRKKDIIRSALWDQTLDSVPSYNELN